MHKDDERWVSKIISEIFTKEVREKALNSYRAIFHETYMNEKNEIKRMNLARREANSRLLKFVKEVKKRGL